MRKLLILLTILMLVGCGRQHIYHTYYGDIDTDTVHIYNDESGNTYFTVKTLALDSNQAAFMGLDSMKIVYYYIPAEDKYFTVAYGSDGGSSPRIYFNPKDSKTNTK